MPISRRRTNEMLKYFRGGIIPLKMPLRFPPSPPPMCVYVISSLIDAQPSPRARKLFSVFPNQMKQSNLLFLFLLHFKSNLPCFLLHNHNNTHASKQMSFNINKNLFGIFQKLLGKNSDSIMDRRVYFWSPHKHIYFCFVP